MPIGELVSVGQDSVAYLDRRNRRVTFIAREGIVGDVAVPTPFSPASEMTGDLRLHGYAFPAAAMHREPVLRMLHVDGASGDVVAAATLALPADAIGFPGILSGAVVLPGGRRVLRLNTDAAGAAGIRLVVFSEAGAFLYALEEPPFRQGRPTERDVERYREEYRIALLGEELAPADEAEFRRRPLPLYPRVALYRGVQEDAAGNLWVLSNRRTDDGTWVEVYRERAYAGSILLRGYVLGIQIRGDVLVALSEEMDDIAGERWLDWYEVVARS